MAAVKVYMPLAEQQLGLAAYAPTLARLGAVLTPIAQGADGVLLTTDMGADKAAGHPKYMPKASCDIVLTRDRLHETGLTTLPTTTIERQEDAPAGSIVKPRNSATGGFVYQPHLGFPIHDLNIHFAVNARSEVCVIAAQRNEHLAAKRPNSLRMARPDEYVGVVQAIEAACKRLGIVGGIHDVQFLWHHQWCAIDWNPRAPLVYTEGIANKYPCLDVAIAHMLGLPAPTVPPAVFINRGYWHKPIPLAMWGRIHELGLLPRRDFAKAVDGIVRINGIGTSAEEVNRLFDQLESEL